MITTLAIWLLVACILEAIDLHTAEDFKTELNAVWPVAIGGMVVAVAWHGLKAAGRLARRGLEHEAYWPAVSAALMVLGSLWLAQWLHSVRPAPTHSPSPAYTSMGETTLTAVPGWECYRIGLRDYCHDTDHRWPRWWSPARPR